MEEQWEMEFGGYVDPPSHLTKAAGKKGAAGPPELRTVPDYDYSLFRYSRMALPMLFMVLILACLLFGLTVWQGTIGLKSRRIPEGIPLFFKPKNLGESGGLSNQLRNIRWANFALGILPLILLVFGIRANPGPGLLRAIFLFSAVLLFGLFCLSMVSFAISIDQISRARECQHQTFNTATIFPLLSCDDRGQMATANTAFDFAQSITAFILCVMLIFTSTKNNWAWGPGNVPVAKNPNRPHIDYPPASPFTHVAETRRVYVYVAMAAFAASLIGAFILAVMLYEHRQILHQVNANNARTLYSGWSMQNTRFRLSLSSVAVAITIANLLDIFAFKKRAFSYVIAALFFYEIIGALVLYSMDVKDLNKARSWTCPTGVDCVFFPYYATCFIEFLLALWLIIYLVYEWLYRVNATWDTYYFYADSEWLRNHSLFVESTDREAYDWKRFTMETGREYYYSPTLGISTRRPPKYYVGPEGQPAPIAV